MKKKTAREREDAALMGLLKAYKDAPRKYRKAKKGEDDFLVKVVPVKKGK